MWTNMRQLPQKDDVTIIRTRFPYRELFAESSIEVSSDNCSSYKEKYIHQFFTKSVVIDL